jgi:polysaccharide biosynthesis/export protein
MRFATVLPGFLVLTLAACASAPRGAGLQSEVLAHQHNAGADGAAGSASGPTDFAVEPVTRERLAIYADWPALGEPGLSWIGHVDQPDTRIIAIGDRISVTVWNTEEDSLLTGPGQRSVTLPDMQVSSAGTVFLPYIGEVRLAGMSPDHARSAIEEHYGEVLPSAQVQVSMAEGRRNMVSLIGGVARPGSYPLPDRDFSVMELIAAAGGVASNIDNPQIRLQRGGRLYGTSVERLLTEPRLDTTLTGGDKVYVDKDKRYFLSLGAAGKESLYPFPKDQLSALDALSLIGGLAPDHADARGILVLRDYPETALRRPDADPATGPANVRTVFTIDLTSADGLFSAGQFRIRPGDLVYVTESPISTARTLLTVLGATIGTVRQATLINN